jgi:hypothetical protein
MILGILNQGLHLLQLEVVGEYPDRQTQKLYCFHVMNSVKYYVPVVAKCYNKNLHKLCIS